MRPMICQLRHELRPLLERPHAELLQELDIGLRRTTTHRNDEARVAEPHPSQEHADFDAVDVR